MPPRANATVRLCSGLIDARPNQRSPHRAAQYGHCCRQTAHSILPVKEEQASGTAKIIAAALVMLHADPRTSGLVPQSAAELGERALEASGANGRRLCRALNQIWFRYLARFVEGITIPGIALHYALRKDCIRKHAREAIEAGIHHAVILGAGFDSLGADLQNEFSTLKVWEIDHPATQRVKSRALTAVQSTGLRLLPVDLSITELKQILSADSAFRAAPKTLWVAEGLLMYFDLSTVQGIFRQTADLCGKGSKFIFTFMRPDSLGRLRFDQQTPLVDWWLRIAGEPFRWGNAPQELGGPIRPWRIRSLYGGDDSTDLSHLSNLGHRAAVGEVICIAEL